MWNFNFWITFNAFQCCCCCCCCHYIFFIGHKRLHSHTNARRTPSQQQILQFETTCGSSLLLSVSSKTEEKINPNYGVARFSIIYIAIMHFRCRRRYTDWFDIVSFRCNNVQSLNKYTHTIPVTTFDWKWLARVSLCVVWHSTEIFDFHCTIFVNPVLSSLSTILSAETTNKIKIRNKYLST